MTAGRGLSATLGSGNVADGMGRRDPLVSDSGTASGGAGHLEIVAAWHGEQHFRHTSCRLPEPRASSNGLPYFWRGMLGPLGLHHQGSAAAFGAACRHVRPSLVEEMVEATLELPDPALRRVRITVTLSRFLGAAA